MLMPESITVARAVTESFTIGDIRLSIGFIDGQICNVIAGVPDEDRDDNTQRTVTLPAEFFERIATAVQERRRYGQERGDHRHSGVCAIHGYISAPRSECPSCKEEAAAAKAPVAVGMDLAKPGADQTAVVPVGGAKLPLGSDAAVVAFMLEHENVSIETVARAHHDDTALFVIVSSVGTYRALVAGPGWTFERIEPPVAVPETAPVPNCTPTLDELDF